ncbi:MAG: DNA mismatch repair endonuclease MutL [Synergistaceae bacterium]|nr:DNA mismatch repair endonuclease MutL [Synergistaceae bacterium]
MSNKIRELSENVWSKIAAGEVVERPASVVKELVENSLDANARRVRVKLTDGGRLKIIVEDDGAGISFEDLPLALTYHATSKISEVEDLEAIHTLGYRGEALASVAAVAQVEIRSRQKDSGTGGMIRASEGKIIEHVKINHPQGTRIQVENLFSGLPARRKFLKSASGELRRAAVFLREYAVCNPDVAFTLEHDDKEIFSTDGSGSKKFVLMKIWGAGNDIQSIKLTHGHLNLECCFQPRMGLASGRNDLIAFVNGRIVNDPVIKSAINQGARELAGNWALFFTLDPSLVDVNIHPAKSEVRFRYPDEIFSAIRKAVSNLGSPMSISVRNETPNFSIPKSKSYAPQPKVKNFSSDTNIKSNRPEQQRQIYLEDFQLKIEDENENVEPEINYLGQNSGGYLIFDNYDGLVLMDPHAAHERINYEKIKNLAAKSQNVQKLLTPILLHPTLALEAHEYEHALKESGFEFENTASGVELKSIPSIGTEFEPEILLRASLGALKNHHDGDTLNILWRTWATMACKASVKLTTKILREEALSIWKNLHECEQPFVCPHGRPTMIEIKNSDLQKRFGRE